MAVPHTDPPEVVALYIYKKAVSHSVSATEALAQVVHVDGFGTTAAITTVGAGTDTLIGKVSLSLDPAGNVTWSYVAYDKTIAFISPNPPDVAPPPTSVGPTASADPLTPLVSGLNLTPPQDNLVICQAGISGVQGIAVITINPSPPLMVGSTLEFKYADGTPAGPFTAMSVTFTTVAAQIGFVGAQVFTVGLSAILLRPVAVLTGVEVTNP